MISYGTGAATLTRCGHSVINLQLPDNNAFLETYRRVACVIARLSPNVVIAHEEFAAAPAAKLFGLPVYFLTDFFASPAHIWMESLAYADEVIFIDEPGIHEPPAYLRDKIYYTGPIIRPFAYCPDDRLRARSELRLQSDAVVVLVLPGGWLNEKRAPIVDLVMPAFKSLPFEKKVLVWIAGQDSELLQARYRDDSDVIVKELDWQIDRWMVACDVAITKGTRITSLELASLGVPSISLSFGLNRPDDIRVARIPSNTALDARTLNSQRLAAEILRILQTQRPAAPSSDACIQSGLSATAARLAAHLAMIREQCAARTGDARPTGYGDGLACRAR
ncbi:MAG: hypothetical protein WA015_19550 [Bryobacteraceae bacterium]